MERKVIMTDEKIQRGGEDDYIIGRLNSITAKMVSKLYIKGNNHVKKMIGNPVKFIAQEYKKFPTNIDNELDIKHIFTGTHKNESVICFHYETAEKKVNGELKKEHKAVVYFPYRNLWLNSNGYTKIQEDQYIGIQWSSLQTMFKNSKLRVNNKLEVKGR